MSNATDTVPVLLTADEAARFLKISRSRLYQRKDIPRRKLPGPNSRMVRWDRNELIAWLKCGQEMQAQRQDSSTAEIAPPSKEVYHRNPKYRGLG